MTNNLTMQELLEQQEQEFNQVKLYHYYFTFFNLYQNIFYYNTTLTSSLISIVSLVTLQS